MAELCNDVQIDTALAIDSGDLVFGKVTKTLFSAPKKPSTPGKAGPAGDNGMSLG